MKGLEKAQFLAAVAVSKKAGDVVVLDMQEHSGFTDFFVIASGSSSRQTRTIADAAIDAAVRSGERPLSLEGKQVGRWILIDFFDVVLHVLQHEARDFYALEKLWGEAAAVEVPELSEQLG